MNLLEMAPTEAIQKAVPYRTTSYTPVSNGALLSAIQENIEDRDLQIMGSNMNTAKNGDVFVGTIQLSSTKINNPELGMTFGFRNSYDKSAAVGFGSGATVFVCTNGMFVADVTAVRKHTSEVWRDVSNIMTQQLDDMEKTFDGIVTDMKELKTTYLSQENVQEIVWNLWVDQKVLTAQQMNILKKEMFYSENFRMYDPKDNIRRGPVNAWNMYNNLTESLKVTHPSKYFKNHSKVHELMMTYTN